MESDSISKEIKQIFEKKFNEEFIIDSIQNKNYSYKDFLSKIISIRKNFEFFEKGEKICCVCKNSYEFLALYFAVISKNLIIIPIEPSKGINEIKKIMEIVNPKLILVDEHRDFKDEKIISEFSKNYENFNVEVKDLEIFDNIDYTCDFLITFTSGTTGESKGVIHSFQNLYLSAKEFSKKFEFNQTNIFYHNLPMSYMAGVLNLIILPFFSQSKIVIKNKFEVQEILNFWETPIKYNVNVFWFIPTIIEMLNRLDKNIESIKNQNYKILGCVGTAPLRSQTKLKFEKKYEINLYESYGLSETLFVSTNSPNDDKIDTVGKTLENVELRFSDDEIIIKTPWSFSGYIGHEKKPVNDMFFSGDLGKLSENYLVITGRKKDIIIKGGINISPKKIEDVILKENVFVEFVIMGFPDEILGEKIVCLYVQDNLELEKEKKKELNKKISELLGIESKIDIFIQVKEIPKNSNGKIDKPKILEEFS